MGRNNQVATANPEAGHSPDGLSTRKGDKGVNIGHYLHDGGVETLAPNRARVGGLLLEVLFPWLRNRSSVVRTLWVPEVTKTTDDGESSSNEREEGGRSEDRCPPRPKLGQERNRAVFVHSLDEGVLAGNGREDGGKGGGGGISSPLTN